MPTKILAIDDSKTMRLGIKITFAAEDAEVVAVSKGSEAVARARQMGADVVLVDHQLAAGEPSGIEVCKMLRSDPSTQNIPIIFLVPARGGVSDDDIKQSGANLVIAKPFETQELIDKVAEVVAAKKVGGSRQPAARVGGMVGGGAVSPSPVSPSPASPVRPPPPTAGSSSQIPLRADAGGRPLLSSPATRSPSAKAKVPESSPRVNTEPAGFAPIPVASRTAAPMAKSNSEGANNRQSGVAHSGDGASKIPIAIPIPFASASAPSNSMLRRLEEARGKGSAAAGDIDPKVAEALLQLSSEVIERVVWEVVPEMAEIIIREKAQNQS